MVEGVASKPAHFKNRRHAVPEKSTAFVWAVCEGGQPKFARRVRVPVPSLLDGRIFREGNERHPLEFSRHLIFAEVHEEMYIRELSLGRDSIYVPYLADG
jgi:hypothetical protein